MSKEARKQEQEESILQGPRPFVVTGTGVASIDVPAVQNAVDNASADGPTRIDLRGTFAFDKSVTIKSWAAIYGLDPSGNQAIIQGGQNPFVVDSSNQPVAITGVHFVNSKESAIRIKSVNGLRITNCTIDPVIPITPPTNPGFNTASGILAASTAQGIAGKILINSNHLDITDPTTVANDPTARTAGIQFVLAAQTIRADITISENNTVKNVTAHGIVLRDITGTATVQGNLIKPGAHGARITTGDSFVDGIMCQGKGEYLITDNRIDCDYENSAGIRLQSTSATVPLTKAVIKDNRIKMSTPSGASNGSESAGIEIRRNCTSNTISNNTLQGDARAVFSLLTDVVGSNKLSPTDNSFLDNDHKSFKAAQADIFVGAEVKNTKIERGTGGKLWDDGQNTDVQPQGNYVKIN